MSKLKKISIIAFVLILVGFIGSIFTFKPMLQSTSITEEKVFKERFSHIEITTDNTSIEILPTTASTAKVDISGKVGKESIYHLSAGVKSSTLSIGVKYKQRSFINFFPSSLSIKVYAPEQLYESLQIKGDDGHIAVDHIQAKEINVQTDNGRIEFTNVKGTTISAKTDDGLSNLKNVKASAVTVKSDNGRINLENIDSKISGKADDGSISLVNNQIDQPIDFQTDNGRINIQTKTKPTNATINASAENGRVDIFSGSNRNVIFGKGENLITLTAADGRITVEKK